MWPCATGCFSYYWCSSCKDLVIAKIYWTPWCSKLNKMLFSCYFTCYYQYYYCVTLRCPTWRTSMEDYSCIPTEHCLAQFRIMSLGNGPKHPLTAVLFLDSFHQDTENSKKRHSGVHFSSYSADYEWARARKHYILVSIFINMASTRCITGGRPWCHILVWWVHYQTTRCHPVATQAELPLPV